MFERFGVDRQLSRAAFTVPGRLANEVFGDIGGYYALRYALILLAIVPAYALFTRLRGRPAGAVAVAVILASPVIVRAWSTDYPMTSAVSYLTAGYCCLLFPSPGARRRMLWVLVGGAFLALAVYSHVVATPLAVAAAAMVVIFRIRFGIRTALVDGVVILVSWGAVSGLLSAASVQVFGSADLWSPSFDAFDEVQSERSTAAFHSTNWRWVLDTPQLAVPLLVLAMWGLLRLRRRHSFSSQEDTLAAVLGSQSVVFTGLQFFRNDWTLEFHYYFEMLWPAVALVVASTVCELGRSLLANRVLRWMPALLVFGVTVALSTAGVWWRMGMVTAMVVGLCTVVGIFMLGRLTTTGRAAMASVAFLTVAFLVTIGQSSTPPFREDQAALANPYYKDVFANSDRANRDLIASPAIYPTWCRHRTAQNGDF